MVGCLTWFTWMTFPPAVVQTVAPSVVVVVVVVVDGCTLKVTQNTQIWPKLPSGII